MATISIAATGLTTRSKTISAADTQRFLDAYKIQFNLPSSATSQQVFNTFADYLFKIMQSDVRSVERTTVADAVAPITVA